MQGCEHPGPKSRAQNGLTAALMPWPEACTSAGAVACRRAGGSNLLKQGVWMGDEGDSFAAAPARAQKLAEAAGGAGGAGWSYFAETPLDMTGGGGGAEGNWVLGESNSSDPLRLDGPAPLHAPACWHRLSRAWWSGCPDGRALLRRCAAAGPGSELWAKEGCGTGVAAAAAAANYTAEWWGSAAGNKAWAACQAGGFGSLAWNAIKCWLHRCRRRGFGKGGACRIQICEID